MLTSLPELRFFLTGGVANGVLGGLALNLSVALVAFVVSFVLAHPLAIARCSSTGWIRHLATAYIEVMRAIPLLMVLFWVNFGVPIMFAAHPAPLLSAVVALTFYAVAYQAEYIRSGIKAIGPGAVDGARSLGLSPLQTLVKITLPQAHKKMLPCYVSYFISLFKDTSALYIVGLVELMQAGLIATERAPGRMLEVYATIGALFFIVSFIASLLGRRLERHLDTDQRACTRKVQGRPWLAWRRTTQVPA